MPRPLKIFFYLLALLLALALAGVVALGILFDPNDYKSEIARQVKRASSLDLDMPGDIGWKLFPRLALSVGETKLHTEKSYANNTLFAELDNFAIGIGWRSLLSGALRADHLQVNGLQLRLVTDHRGHSNWKDVEAQQHARGHTGDASESGGLALELADLTLRNIDVRIVDQQLGSDQQFSLQELQAEYVNLDGRPFPLSFDARFSDEQRSAAIKLQADALIDNAKEQYALQNMQGRLDNSNFSGTVKIGLGKKTTFDGELAMDELNLDTYLGEPDSGTADGSSGAEDISFDVLKSLNTRFKVSIDRLVASNARFSQVSVDTAVAGGVLDLKNFRAQVFGGNIALGARLNASRKPATLELQQDFAQVQIAEVLENRDIAVNLSGKASIKSTLSMRGNSVDAWMASLAGKTEFVFDEGRYGDDNITYRVCQAVALARNEVLGAATDSGTSFESIQATIAWQNGVGSITSFSAGLQNLKLGGDGKLSLPGQSFDLRILANVSGDLSGSYPACVINEKYRNIKWPLRCRGDANTSKCGVDNSRLDKILAGMVKDRAREELREKATKKIEEKLGKGVGEALKGLFQ